MLVIVKICIQASYVLVTKENIVPSNHYISINSCVGSGPEMA